MDLNQKDIAIRQYVSRAIAYAITAILSLAALLYLAISREVFKPLWRIMEGAREVARGNLDKHISLGRNDELGELSKEFNVMTEALRRREEENYLLLHNLREKWFEAEEKSHTDFLTNLENHRSFHISLENTLNHASRQGSLVSLLFCDLDKFKVFNDTNGHLLGDRALHEVAKAIRKSLRNYDIAARYGGEEFAVILPSTDTEDAVMIGERIRKSVESHQFITKEGTGKMTISIGVATYPKDTNDKDMLIVAADTAMYESKRHGGNLVTVFKSTCDIDLTKACCSD